MGLSCQGCPGPSLFLLCLHALIALRGVSCLLCDFQPSCYRFCGSFVDAANACGGRCVSILPGAVEYTYGLEAFLYSRLMKDELDGYTLERDRYPFIYTTAVRTHVLNLPEL